MNHPTEEELILYYYSEGEDQAGLEQHLGNCEGCQALYASLERTLEGIDVPVPERGAGYEASVWERLQAHLPSRGGFRLWLPWHWAAAGAALAAMLTLAFLAGRYFPGAHAPGDVVGNSRPGERVLFVALGDHLERSQVVLTELANAAPADPLDISFEQQRATDLLNENRLYRQTAADTGDTTIAAILDELERILLEIEHAPSRISPAELDDLQLRLRAEGILFKLRVVDSNMRNQQEPARKPL